MSAAENAYTPGPRRSEPWAVAEALWKRRTARHAEEAAKEPDGAEPWGNACERRGCLKSGIGFFAGREVCETHKADALAATRGGAR